MGLNKLMDQEQTPVCTGISLLTTVAVEALIFVAAGSEGFGGMFLFYLAVAAVVIGGAVNMMVGFFGYQRHEYWCGRIAAAGVAVWLVTVSILLRSR